MRNIIRLLRRNQVVNSAVRKMLLKLRGFVDKAITYWPVSGIVEFKTEGLTIKLLARADDGLTTKLYYQKNWEAAVLPWFVFFSRRSGLIVDAGANIGLYSLLASIANPISEIYAFEPNPHNLDRLRANLRLNGAEARVRVVPSALGSEDGEISLHYPADGRVSDVSSVYSSHTTSFNDFNHTQTVVPLISLDSFFKGMGHKVDLVKIDVELYELQVLKGMTEILSKDRPVILCEIFNDTIRRKTNPNLQQDIKQGYTQGIASLLANYGYFYYSMTDDGLVEVPDFSYSPMSSMYLLMPDKLAQSHYLYSERHLIESQL